mgnify:CR=1 FL=1|jgi:hypothetical protein
MEVKEERKIWVKDIQIVRQSSVKIALEFCKVHGIQPTLRELFRLTDIFAENALVKPNNETKITIARTDKWIEEKKKKN